MVYGVNERKQFYWTLYKTLYIYIIKYKQSVVYTAIKFNSTLFFTTSLLALNLRSITSKSFIISPIKSVSTLKFIYLRGRI